MEAKIIPSKQPIDVPIQSTCFAFDLGINIIGLTQNELTRTVNDVLLLPGTSSVLTTDVHLKTKLTCDMFLNIPLLAAATNTVTEARLAIALAQEGGLGIIHKNMPIEQ